MKCESTTSDMQALESAAFAAWPSASAIDLHGWRLRLDQGYTKRTNSLNATEQSRNLSLAEIDGIEKRFRQQGLAPTFRITSFSPVAETDSLLARKGYLHCGSSLVMTRRLCDADACNQPDPALAQDARQWLETFQAVSRKSGSSQALHLAILKRISHPTAWAVLEAAGSPLCCGLGVIVDHQMGLFDIASHACHQRQGLARRLCGQMLAWGYRRGARLAFLQVEASNTAALRLYQGLGFQPVYHYWYRVLA